MLFRSKIPTVVTVEVITSKIYSELPLIQPPFGPLIIGVASFQVASRGGTFQEA